MESWNSASFALPPTLSTFPHKFQNKVLHALVYIFVFKKKKTTKQPQKSAPQWSPYCQNLKIKNLRLQRTFLSLDIQRVVHANLQKPMLHCTDAQSNSYLASYPAPCKADQTMIHKGGASLSFSRVLWGGIFIAAARHRECWPMGLEITWHPLILLPSLSTYCSNSQFHLPAALPWTSFKQSYFPPL